MKIPGIGDVKNSWVAIGGSVFAGVLGYAYYKNHKANAAAATASAAAADSTQYADTGGSPDYGTNYGGEYYSGYGGVDPNTGVPYAYENYMDYGQSSSSSTITTNEEWVTEAIQDAEGFGATYAVAQSAVETYMAQTPTGLSAGQYTLMQGVVAELGQPPTGGPYRLIQASSGVTSPPGGGSNPPPSGGQPPSSGGGETFKNIAGGEVINVPVNIVPPNTMQKVATQYGISLQHLINNNPGKNAKTTGVVQVPYDIPKGMTLDKLASTFGISPEHMAQVLSSQGII